ncbi:MAG: cell division/cell wall cluster transcriptional repressor MraZ [Candidatus Sungbacteria bacterium RIFCSPLOWO2_01_FULL_59_16]|uniref:Transcriptional regulator MraZ n=1 Tax=Candidatus Sungbacteria bacterium RIFCSPLOWO2_01_FULL_59_16 TaxID=1802280 RepID=A0A1G2LBU5_9BACT|nr:MAG: cell division/cell wall cluster transcriptional repressor MraZ [Candidatus Sungbacteria bacterium RIFCSPLOWO2_01_FULL_59_16]
MLLGEYQHSVDEKGRLAVPAKFRRVLAEGVVVTKGLDGCLYLYPLGEWGTLAEKLSKLPINQADSRAFSRMMLAGANHAEIDAQGRILIPEYLRRYAGIAGRAVIVGLYNRAEIWDEGKWQRYRSDVEGRTDEIAERLGELGI